MKRIAAILVMLLLLAGCSRIQVFNPGDQAVTPAASNEVSQTQEPTPESTPEESAVPAAESTNAGVVSPAEITTPVLIKGLLVGGVYQGAWMPCEEFYNSGAVDFDGFLYDVYVDGMQKGSAAGGVPTDALSGEPLTEDVYMPGYDAVALYDESNREMEYDIALAADWNLYPRGYTDQGADQKDWQDATKALLIREGVENPVTSLKQVIHVDLDGDGTEEVLITADNTINGQFEQVKKGDHAILIFRNMVNGRADQVVDKDIFPEDVQEDTIYRLLYRVEDIADLDGDGTLEVIIRSWYYEGEEWAVYKLINHRLELVASNGWGA